MKFNTKKLKGIFESALFPVLAVALALVVTYVILFALGYDASKAMVCLAQGAFGSLNNIGETMVKAIPLMLLALSFAFANRCGMYNLGAMGQFYMGAILGGLVGYGVTGLTGAIHIPFMLICGFIGGAVFALIPALLKVYFGANELISTIMLSNIATQFLNMMVAGPMKDLNSSNGASQSPMMLDSVTLPVILPGTRLHAGLFIAIAAILIYWFFYSKTVRGYEIKVVGTSHEVAQYAGIPVKKNQLLTMMIGGGIAGIAGCVELMSVQSRLIVGFSGSFGFRGICVALLGNCSPLGITLSSVLYGAMTSGANRVQMLAQVPDAMLEITEALIILFLASREVLKYRNRKLNPLKLNKGGSKA